MKYRDLKTILHMTDYNTYEKEYKQRFNSYSVIKFPLYIKDKNGDATLQLFTVFDLEMLNQIIRIENRMNKIKIINRDRIDAFKIYYIKKLFVEELVSTNEIEGVHTTRKDIVNAYDKKIDPNKSKLRHNFLVYKYQQLLSENDISLKKLSDIRKVYDELLSGEISKEDQLDGKLFRRDGVSVNIRKNIDRVVHDGINGEENINSHLISFLNYLNDETTNEHIFIKVAILHYYFGYVHPFYDGNGRTSRFISSHLLNENDHQLLALKLSTVIREMISEYDKAFITTNNNINMGEATFFVKMFINVLDKASTDLYEDLKNVERKIINFNKTFIDNNVLYDKLEIDILRIIYNASLCEDIINVDIIAKNVNKTRQTVVKRLISLDSVGLVSHSPRKPIELTNKFFQLLNV